MVVPFMLGVLPILGFASYAVTQKERVLEHPHREKIVELAEKVPGITQATAQGHLGCSKSAMDHHVRILVARECLWGVCVRHLVHLFPAGTKDAQKIAVLMERDMRGFAKAVVKRPGTNLADISEKTGFAPKVLRRCARALVQAGLVEDSGTKTRHSYEPTAALALVLERVEAIMAAERDLETAHAATSEAVPDG